MNANNRCIVPFTLVAATLLILLAAAGSERSQTTPAVVSIRLTAVLEGLEETGQLRAHFREIEDRIANYRAEKEALIKALQEERDTLQRDSPRYNEKHEELLNEAAALGAWLQVKTGMRDLEETREYLRMYDKILGAAQELAETAGYDYILLDDGDVPITPGTPEETVAQLFTRRMIYANPMRDVTDDLIQRMNNAFNAGIE